MGIAVKNDMAVVEPAHNGWHGGIVGIAPPGFLERRGLLERDAENSYLALETGEDDAMMQLQGHSIIYRIAVGLQQGRKVFLLQTLPLLGFLQQHYRLCSESIVATHSRIVTLQTAWL